MYAKIENNTPVEWPVRDFQIRNSVSASLPEKLIPEGVAEYGFEPYAESAKIECNPLIQTVSERSPIKQDGIWVQQWEVVELYDATERDRILAEEAVKAEESAKSDLQNSIVSATQKRLDDFAHTRNYDGILSLCTYATSLNPKFKAEGQYGVEARDATWAKLYEMLAEVEAGTRPKPSGYADIEAELPVLAWPV